MIDRGIFVILKRVLAVVAVSLMLAGAATAGPFEVGLAAYKRGDYVEAAKWYRLAADRGHADAQINLGFMYEKGQGVPWDYAQAVKWYHLAADQGRADAQYKLGVMYGNRPGFPDYPEAVKWYRLAADQGYADAQYKLGVTFQYGLGVPLDKTEAIKWYRLAAEKGFADAMQRSAQLQRDAARNPEVFEMPQSAEAETGVKLDSTQALRAGRFALIVANLAYKGAELVNPVTDARLVQNALLKLGFDVTLAVDADLARFDEVLRKFESRAEGAEIALFYYAGHGFALNDSLGASNYLMAVDADVTSTSDRLIRAGGIPLDEIVGSLADRAETTLVFVDACRNDPRLTRGSGRGRGLAPISSVGSGSLFVGISTKLGELAEDGEDGEGSPFARAFAENIGEPGTRIDDAFNSIRLTVKKETNGLQQPEVVRYELNAPLVLNDEPQANHIGDVPPAPEAPRNVLTTLLKPDGTLVPRRKDAGKPVANPPLTALVPAEPQVTKTPKDHANEGPTSESDAMLRGSQKAIFYEERTSTSEGTAEPGTTVWSLVQESPGGNLPPEPAIRAEAVIPGKNIKLRMTIKRNADHSLPASHIIEMIFITPEDFPGGGVDNILRVAMKGSEPETGNPLIGIPAKIADGYFLVALDDSKAVTDANLMLLRRQSWIDIPVVYKSGRRALFTIEKGPPASKIFEAVLGQGAADSIVRLKGSGKSPTAAARIPERPRPKPSSLRPDSFWDMVNGQ